MPLRKTTLPLITSKPEPFAITQDETPDVPNAMIEPINASTQAPTNGPNSASLSDAPSAAPRAATVSFMLQHPAHALALGFGSGLSPVAPGTVGTLWAWLSFVVLAPWLSAGAWAGLIVVSLVVGVWACTRCAQGLRVADPSSIVWDEVVAFWLVLWLIAPAPWWQQLIAFALFRYFDAAKPGPVGWADRLFKVQPGQALGVQQGIGILLDDLVAAFCTLVVMALLTRWVW
jgi:phosphatidylglycerophosphatase A